MSVSYLLIYPPLLRISVEILTKEMLNSLWFSSQCHSIPRTAPTTGTSTVHPSSANENTPSFPTSTPNLRYQTSQITRFTSRKHPMGLLAIGVKAEYQDAILTAWSHNQAEILHQAQGNTTETCKSRPILSLSPSHLDGLGTTGKRRARVRTNPTLAATGAHVYILVRR